MKDNLILAWSAGVFESEGSVRINTISRRNWGSLICDIPSTDKQMVAPFLERWDGSMKHYKASPPRKEYWRWRIASKQALIFLEAIRPYLKTDRIKEKVDVGIEFQKQKRMGGGANRTREYYDDQWSFYLKMRGLNFRGIQTITWRHELISPNSNVRFLAHMPQQKPESRAVQEEAPCEASLKL